MARRFKIELVSKRLKEKKAAQESETKRTEMAFFSVSPKFFFTVNHD